MRWLFPKRFAVREGDTLERIALNVGRYGHTDIDHHLTVHTVDETGKDLEDFTDYVGTSDGVIMGVVGRIHKHYQKLYQRRRVVDKLVEEWLAKGGVE